MTQRFPNKIFTLCFAAQVGRRMLSCASMLEMRKWSTCGEAQARLTQRTPSQLSSPGIVISHDFSWQIYPYICCFFFSPILILAQRAWQPLPWHPSMTKGCWITRRGKTWTLIIILGQDLWLLARVWKEWKGEDNSGRSDETWGDTSQIERHEMKHFGKCI